MAKYLEMKKESQKYLAQPPPTYNNSTLPVYSSQTKQFPPLYTGEYQRNNHV